MIARLVVCAVALVANFAEANPKRRAAPDKFTKAAGNAFARALDAEAKGDLAAAVEQYRTSLEISVHANTLYNLADLEVRLGRVFDALVSYEAYLALLPNAPDRAEIEATMAELRKRPARFDFYVSSGCKVELAEAYVLVDGVIVRKPGAKPPLPDDKSIAGAKGPYVTVMVPHGVHTVDLVTDISYASRVVDARAGGNRQQIELCGGTRVDGNMVFQTGEQITATLDARDIDRRGAREVIPPGKHRLKLVDRDYDCAPISIEAPKGEAISYVHIAPTELTGAAWGEATRAPFRCRKLAVTRHMLTF